MRLKESAGLSVVYDYRDPTFNIRILLKRIEGCDLDDKILKTLTLSLIYVT